MISDKDYRYLVLSLAHELRTPLSVILNEASYLQSMQSTEETSKIVEKVRQISAMLTAWELVRPSERLSVEESSSVLSEVVKTYKQVYLENNKLTSELGELVGDTMQWRFFLTEVLNFFPKDEEIHCDIVAQEGLLFQTASQPTEISKSYSSFADLFVGQIGRSKMLYSMLDAIVSGMNLSVCLIWTGKLCQVRITKS